MIRLKNSLDRLLNTLFRFESKKKKELEIFIELAL